LKREKRLVSTRETKEYPDYLELSAEEKYIDNEIQTEVHRAISNLPERCRRIFLMKRYDDLSYNEIASILNISINTVKTQMKRALKFLRMNLAHLISIALCLLMLNNYK
jgi:RNA polymerase sigma-70 factor (ECF subfamily)